jgi:hypothetical protein
MAAEKKDTMSEQTSVSKLEHRGHTQRRINNKKNVWDGQAKNRLRPRATVIRQAKYRHGTPSATEWSPSAEDAQFVLKREHSAKGQPLQTQKTTNEAINDEITRVHLL